MSRSLSSQLASLIGLDEETTTEQIIPHLNSITSQNEIRNYLETLLAPGSASQSFIQHYLQSRFPTTSKPSSRWTTPTNSRSASPLPPPSHSTSTKQQQKSTAEIEKAFNGAGGKVYMKSQTDLDDSWGGGGNKGIAGKYKASTSSNNDTRQPPSTSSSNPIESKGKKTQTTTTKVSIPNEPDIEFSEPATKELVEIDRALKQFQDSKSTRNCFCGARQHPLSLYSPLCPTCALVICSLNSPTSPCPSCSHHPLISPTLSQSYISQLTESRTTLIERERQRTVLARERLERERQQIRFPELGADYRPQPNANPMTGMGYAGHAGGGMSMNDRIQMAYENGISLNGGNLREEKKRMLSNNQGKVLRLDGKGKVKVQTKVAKPSSSKDKQKSIVVEEKELEVEDFDDGMIPWIDETDDGYNSSKKKNPPSEGTRGKRVFENVTLREGNRPTWIEREELRHSIVDEDVQDQAVIDSVPDQGSTTAIRVERKVPGALPVGGGEGGSKKKGRGKKVNP